MAYINENAFPLINSRNMEILLDTITTHKLKPWHVNVVSLDVQLDPL